MAIIVVDDDVADVEANTKFDQLILRHIDVLINHATLNFDGASRCDRALANSTSMPSPAVSRCAAMVGSTRPFLMGLQLRQRALLIDAHQAA